jgi:hypothetical protein
LVTIQSYTLCKLPTLPLHLATTNQPLQELSNYQKAHVFPTLPSLLEFLGFVFCFGNLLAGPVIEFRDYQMWVRHEGPWAPSARKVPWTGDFKAVGGDDVSLVMVVRAMSGTLHGRVRTQAPCTGESRLPPSADETQNVSE